jgi:DNA-binding MarR family transcriptional regulator
VSRADLVDQVLAWIDEVAPALRHLPGEDELGASAALVLQVCLPPATVTQTEIVNRLGASRAGTSQLIHRLETAGLVTRQPDPNDQRVWLVQATTRGVAAYAAARETRRSAVHNALSAVPVGQRDNLSAALPALAALCSAMTPPAT